MTNPLGNNNENTGYGWVCMNLAGPEGFPGSVMFARFLDHGFQACHKYVRIF